MSPDPNLGNIAYHIPSTSYTAFKRNDSLEVLNPAADSPLRKSNLNFGTFNLVATIVGGGVLSLPLAFAKAGVVLATIMMVFSAAITDFSLYIICCCARRTGSASYMAIVKAAFGPFAEICTTVVILLFLSGVLVAFYVLLKGIFAPLARDFVSNYTTFTISPDESNFDALVLLSILVAVFPLMLKKNLYALRHICYVGFMSVCVIAISIGIRAIQRNTTIVGVDNTSDSASEELIKIKYFPTDWMDALFVFPIIMLSFLCHYNMVEVHGALKNPTRKRVKTVIHTAVTSTFVLFEVFGLAGYFYAYSACKGNIFLNFDPSDKLIMLGRVGMGVTLAFATPVATLPCREALLSLYPQIQEWKNIKNQGTEELTKLSEAETLIVDDSPFNSTMNSYSSFAESEEENIDDIEQVKVKILSTTDDTEDRHIVVHVATTVMLVVSAYFCAIKVPGVAVVWSILGSSLGMIIGFIIPCSCYLKIRSKKSAMRFTNCCALCLLLFSTVIAMICTTQSIYDLLAAE